MYRKEHPDENYEDGDSYPDYGVLRNSVSRENLVEWLSILDARVDMEKCMDNPKFEKAMLHVFVCGYRYVHWLQH